jgi:hypothetical protein
MNFGRKRLRDTIIVSSACTALQEMTGDLE